MRDRKPICFTSSLHICSPFHEALDAHPPNPVVVWDQEGCRKSNLALSHFYVHLKHFIREMDLSSKQSEHHHYPKELEIVTKMGRVQHALSSHQLLILTCWSLERPHTEVIFIFLDHPFLHYRRSLLCNFCAAEQPLWNPASESSISFFRPHSLEEFQLGEGDSFSWVVGEQVRTNKTSNWLCHVQPNLGSVSFISFTMQN